MAINPLSLKIGIAILPCSASNDIVNTATISNFLHAVTNPKDRHIQVEICWVCMWRTLCVHTRRASRQDNTGRFPTQIGQSTGAWNHLRVDMQVSQAACDQVGASKVSHVMS